MQRRWKRRWQRLASVVAAPLAAGVLLLSVYSPVCANPTGGTLVNGNATVTVNGTTMTIQQKTPQVILNWQNFSIGSGERVQFIQPGIHAVALNRVIGNNASTIYGSLSANGRVFLINPNGVLFAPGAQVNAGGLVVSSLNMTDGDFLKGKYVFNGGTGSIKNAGTITTANEAVLIGPHVENEGVIAAKVTGLAAGNKVSLDFHGDKLLNVTVDAGAAGGSAVNRGELTANGGTVIMTAGTKATLLDTVVNNSGLIRAQSLTNENGLVRLEGNRVLNSGVIDASGRSVGQTGGTVKLLGDKVSLAEKTAIDVSGDAGGGTVLIGGAYQGASSEYAAANTNVAAGATIQADAVRAGNGGSVVIWANDKTDFAGSISARGGATGGAGGQVEVSGKNTLTYRGYVTTTAAAGKTGTLLLDPADYTIGAGATGANYWNSGDLATALTTSNITVQTAAGAGNGDIIVAAPFSGGGGHDLTLAAHRNIVVNAPFVFDGGGTLTFTPNKAYAFDGISNGNLLVNSGGSVKVNAGNLFISGQQYTLINTLGDWNNIRNNMGMGTCYALNADIAGVTSPTGKMYQMAAYKAFEGTLEGLGHKVSIAMNTEPFSNPLGLFGRVDNGLIRNVGVDGTINGNAQWAGGLVGSNNGGNIINCYSNVNLNMGTGDNIGGLVGKNIGSAINTGMIVNSYSTGTVNATQANTIGGLVGTNAGTISKSYSTAAVTSNSGSGAYAGGLVGENKNAMLVDSYSTGNVSGDTAGGLVGHNYSSGNINNSFSSGNVSGVTRGGLVGDNDSGVFGGSVANSFWNTDTSMLANGNGSGGLAGATGLTTAQMQKAATFSSWDPTIWKFYDGSSQPVLKPFLKSVIVTTNAANVTKTYDGLASSYGGIVSYSTGVRPAEVLGTLGYSGGGINAGVYTPTGLYSGQQGYDISFVNIGGTLTVNKATLTYTATGANRTYRDANPLLSGTVTGFKGSDTLGGSTTGTISWGTTAGVGSNAGSYAINGSGLTAANYNFVQDAANATALTVNKATLTYTATGANRTYGDANPLLSGTVTGFKGSDTLAGATTGTLNWSTTAGAGSSVGNYGINGGGLTATNYNFVQDATNATALTVNKATLTYRADGANRTYGDANPLLSGTVTGFKGSDTLAGSTGGTLSWGTTAGSGSNVGGYAITGGGLTATNYDFVQDAANATALTVNKATLTYKANGVGRTYGDANPLLGGTVTGFKGSDTLAGSTSGTLSWGTAAGVGSNAGNYAINGSGLTAVNYNFVQDAANATALTVNKAMLSVTADALTKIYGNADPALTYRVGGLVNGDLASGVLTGTLSRTAGETVTGGPYAIGKGTLAANGNYDLGYTGANLTVTPRTVFVTADNSRRYAGQPNPAFSASYSGLAAGDTAAMFTGALQFTTTASNTSAAGNYEISLSGSLASPNYIVRYGNGMLAVSGKGNVPAYDTAVIYADHLASKGAGMAGMAGRGALRNYRGLLSGHVSEQGEVPLVVVGVNPGVLSPLSVVRQANEAADQHNGEGAVER